MPREADDVYVWTRVLEVIVADQIPSKTLVGQLRARGPSSLDKLFALRSAITNSKETDSVRGRGHRTDQLARLDKLIDRVGRQKHCTLTRAFWHDDLEAAKQSAGNAGKPILALRLTGDLSEQLDCGEDREIRLVLYSNSQISSRLRDNFILHWQSVYPERNVATSQANERDATKTPTYGFVHYVLTPEGKVLDGLPGFYDPSSFCAWLDQTRELSRISMKWPSETFAEQLGRYHERELTKTQTSSCRQPSISDSHSRNGRQLHQVLHSWFSRGEAAGDVEWLNQRVFDELLQLKLVDPVFAALKRPESQRFRNLAATRISFRRRLDHLSCPAQLGSKYGN